VVDGPVALEDRFHLKVHRETRKLPVYDLVVATNGVKMKLSEDQTDPSDRQNRGLTTTQTASGETIISGSAIPIAAEVMARRPYSLPPASLSVLLSSYARRPVIDKTNLKGLFDFRLQFLSEALLLTNPNAPGASIFTAVQEQLGLKLESNMGPAECSSSTAFRSRLRTESS